MALPYATVTTKLECKNCSLVYLDPGRVFSCVLCEKDFCALCFVTGSDERGSTYKCPQCEKTMWLPTQERKRYE